LLVKFNITPLPGYNFRMSMYVGTFLPAFIKNIFTVYLLCARHTSRAWEYSGDRDADVMELTLAWQHQKMNK
jgi:hypothetical protein